MLTLPCVLGDGIEPARMDEVSASRVEGGFTVWGFGQITNKTSQTLMFDYAVGSGGTATGDKLNATRGNAILEVGALGAIYFTDVGHQPDGPHYWAVDIQFGDTTKRWFYDGGGVLDVQVNADGTFVLSGQGQTITGSISSEDTPFGPVGVGVTATV